MAENQSPNPEQFEFAQAATLGEAAIGTIEPAPRLEAGEIDAETLRDCVERLASGEFHRSVGLDQILPAKCVDGRPRTDGVQELAPNSAGGSFSLVVADMLTSQNYRNYGGQIAEDTAEYARNAFQSLKDSGYGEQLGDHCDDHAEGEKCGCGAVDKMQPIVGYIADHADEVRSLAEALGVEVDDETHEVLAARSAELSQLDNLAFSPGADAMSELRAAAGDETVEKLAGSHNEVVVTINTHSGTTLDRAGLREQFGDKYQAFNVDIWALEETAATLSSDETETRQQFAAMVYYNIATAAVLGGKSLRIVTVA